MFRPVTVVLHSALTCYSEVFHGLPSGSDGPAQQSVGSCSGSDGPAQQSVGSCSGSDGPAQQSVGFCSAFVVSSLTEI